MFPPSISAAILSVAVPMAVTEENFIIPLSTVHLTGLERSVIISEVLSIHSIMLFTGTFISVECDIGIADL